MSTVKVNFEIGHEASIRTKKTPEGFTHDWEIFVRGVDNADISLFIDKVVFQLHETFPRPKRVVKEPPYSVRESGYAGFNLPIEIYLKNRGEPKKMEFEYNLHLQQSGPPIIKVRPVEYVFNNPCDEFKRKLLKGGGFIVSNNNLFSTHSNIEHERSRDAYSEDKPQQLIGKPKLSSDKSKKHKSKDHRLDDLPRPTNSFVNLFGTPIHKTSHVIPDIKKPSPNPKVEKKEKEKSYTEKEKIKTKSEPKEKDENKYREEKAKSIKDDKDKSKEERKSKSHKDRDSSKDKGSKRVAERPPSPAPPPKKAIPPGSSSPKPNLLPPPKEEVKSKYVDIESKNKPVKSESHEYEKKLKKEKKSQDKERENKKEHKKEKESKVVNPEKEVKPKDTFTKEVASPLKEKDKPTEKKPEKPFNKFSIDNMLKDPSESKHRDGSKHRDKNDKERKHKHKKKDKKRDESKEKSKESSSKEKKHKHEKHPHREKYSENKEPVVERVEPTPPAREIDKPSVSSKSYKEKDRSQLTISPISLDTSSQSSSKSISKNSKSSMLISNHSSPSNSDSDVSLISDEEDISAHSETNSKSSKLHPSKPLPEPVKVEPVKEKALKVDKHPQEKTSSPSTSHKSKMKEKFSKHEEKSEKKSKKRKSTAKDEMENNNKVSKNSEDDNVKKAKDNTGAGGEGNLRSKVDASPRLKTDTKVQDDGVSSSLSDHPLKCDSPLSEDTSQLLETNRKAISPDYMLQLKELQQRIMTIQSNDELERVVNLIAETGKYEVTKKTFDFDLCLLDRSTVQQLQELIGCESRA